MSTSIRTFNTGIYREHLEEASFLYDQRLAYLRDPAVSWLELCGLEERLDAHIDGLVLGGDLAAESCRLAAGSEVPGDLYAALVVLGRQNRLADTFAALRLIDFTKDGIADAATAALRSGAGPASRDDLQRELRNSRGEFSDVLIDVLGYRRGVTEGRLHEKLSDEPTINRAVLARALGRVGTHASIETLWSLFDSDDDGTCEAAALALMRLHDRRPLHRAMAEAGTARWARRVLAIGGDSRAVAVLRNVVETGTDDPDAVVALGLLGDLSSVAGLLDLLEGELAKPAAIALNMITGAALSCRVFVPDEVDRDELSDDERDADEQTSGLLPRRRFGTWEVSPLLDKAAWRSWLSDNKSRFSRDRRWRFGAPYSAHALVRSLWATTTAYPLRATTYEELVVRYGLDVPFEADLWVSQQRRVRPRIEQWALRHKSTYEDGQWYFAGLLER